MVDAKTIAGEFHNAFADVVGEDHPLEVVTLPTTIWVGTVNTLCPMLKVDSNATPDGYWHVNTPFYQDKLKMDDAIAWAREQGKKWGAMYLLHG